MNDSPVGNVTLAIRTADTEQNFIVSIATAVFYLCIFATSQLYDPCMTPRLSRARRHMDKEEKQQRLGRKLQEEQEMDYALQGLQQQVQQLESNTRSSSNPEMKQL